MSLINKSVEKGHNAKTNQCNIDFDYLYLKVLR